MQERGRFVSKEDEAEAAEATAEERSGRRRWSVGRRFLVSPACAACGRGTGATGHFSILRILHKIQN